IYFPLFPEGKPAEFSDCWRYPTAPLEEGGLANRLGTAERDPGFLFFPMSSWHSRIQRTQQFATALAQKGHLCCLVNPHLGRQFETSYHRDRGPRFTVLGNGLAEAHIRLRSEPVFHSRMLTAGESRNIADALSLLQDRTSPEMVQVLSLPVWL